MAGSQHGDPVRVLLHHWQCCVAGNLHARSSRTGKRRLYANLLSGLGLNAESCCRDRHGCIIASLLEYGCELLFASLEPPQSLTAGLCTGIRQWITVMASKHGGRGNRADWGNSLSTQIRKLDLGHLLISGKSRNRFPQLHPRQYVRDGLDWFRQHTSRRIHGTHPLHTYVLFYLGNLPHAHTVPRLLQRTNRYFSLSVPDIALADLKPRGSHHCLDNDGLIRLLRTPDVARTNRLPSRFRIDSRYHLRPGLLDPFPVIHALRSPYTLLRPQCRES